MSVEVEERVKKLEEARERANVAENARRHEQAWRVEAEAEVERLAAALAASQENERQLRKTLWMIAHDANTPEAKQEMARAALDGASEA